MKDGKKGLIYIIYSTDQKLKSSILTIIREKPFPIKVIMNIRY
jgi:hypothetical protein